MISLVFFRRMDVSQKATLLWIWASGFHHQCRHQRIPDCWLHVWSLNTWSPAHWPGQGFGFDIEFGLIIDSCQIVQFVLVQQPLCCLGL